MSRYARRMGSTDTTHSPSAPRPDTAPDTASATATRKVLLGATPGGDDGTDLTTAMTNFESQIGRKLDLVRVFDMWDTPFPRAYDEAVFSGNRQMLLSVRPKLTNGTAITWRAIADAPVGSTLYNQTVAWADKVKATGRTIWFNFGHEPETGANLSQGVNTDYIDAWRKVVSIFRARGATNAKFAWIMTDWSFEVASSDRRSAAKWYPGDAYVDYIASDSYNWSTCRTGYNTPWRSLEQIITPLRTFGTQHPDKGLILAEWASAEQNGDKGAWFDAVPGLLAKSGYEQFVAVSYFNRIDPGFPNCNFRITSSAGAKAGFIRMANSPIFTTGITTGSTSTQTLLTTTLNSADTPNPRWTSATYTPATSGQKTITLSWSGTADLRMDVRRASDGAWIGADTDTSNPKSVTATLSAGTAYQVAVWSMSGSATATVTVTP